MDGTPKIIEQDLTKKKVQVNRKQLNMSGQNVKALRQPDESVTEDATDTLTEPGGIHLTEGSKHPPHRDIHELNQKLQ